MVKWLPLENVLVAFRSVVQAKGRWDSLEIVFEDRSLPTRFGEEVVARHSSRIGKKELSALEEDDHLSPQSHWIRRKERRCGR